MSDSGQTIIGECKHPVGKCPTPGYCYSIGECVAARPWHPSHKLRKEDDESRTYCSLCMLYQGEKGTDVQCLMAETSSINHPQHYGGDTTYEAIKVIEAWGLGFCLGNAVKYICRAGKKDKAAELEDLKKARWYLDREIQRLEKK